MLQQLIEELNCISKLTDKEQKLIKNLIAVKHLDEGDYWYYEGKETDQVAFVAKGYLRKYYMVEEEEITECFYFEGSFTGDLPSIISQVPCKSFNVAMESTTLLTLSYQELNELARQSINIERLLRKVTEQSFVMYHEKVTSFLLQSPRERFENLFLKKPIVFKKASANHIASYLGITPQHFSRLRSIYLKH
ncbi:Crp/Fnr family transcriptional regulator [Flammeovirga sp. EKP202]|uniref:Crp/Fnr family transcriptional regulator n=1 Tax=Flammeovirga sp. EKP202 TaxID=2770592 RepID=UPI00165F072D|nr:Crp/Fnr family transcriptional regulator [Flammeovirga sp. EKP202]MBD0401572.1 Crp/Fnr family transcriptional regulator [Flammeovirga sp. EKP202]